MLQNKVILELNEAQFADIQGAPYNFQLSRHMIMF